MRLYLRSTDRRPDPAPLRTDDRAAVLVGMLIWTLLWIAALVWHARLADTDRGWWIWTPPAGIALGALGLLYLHRRQRPGR